MKKRTVLIYIIVVLLIVGTVCFYLFGSQKDEGKEIIISKESTNDYVLEKYKEGFVTFNGTELIHYNNGMEQKWVLAIDEEGAGLYVEDAYILLFNKDTGKMYIIKDGETMWNIKTENELRAASINRNGYVCALTSDKGYKGQCIVYGKEGKSKAEYSFGERYILGAYLAEDNRTLIMNVIEDTDDGFCGKILYSDIDSGEIFNETVSESIYSYLHVYKNKVFAYNENGIYCYDKKGREKWNYSFGSGEVLDIDFSGKRIIMTIKTGEGFGGGEVLSFSLSGRLKGRFQTESHITAFDTSDGYSAVMINNEIILLNKRCRVVSTTEAVADAEEIKLYKNENRILFLSDKAIMRKLER